MPLQRVRYLLLLLLLLLQTQRVSEGPFRTAEGRQPGFSLLNHDLELDDDNELNMAPFVIPSHDVNSESQGSASDGRRNTSYLFRLNKNKNKGR
ncbi:hypothetical protein L218DRAFT_692995 [Marasmius fiardii PR-910]|nr:hypothetical protein L218DRAFT_692995 [Marasmius fiardii PR-910]